MDTIEKIDIDLLPEEYRVKLFEYYEYLLWKADQKQKGNMEEFFKTVEAMKFTLPEDYKFER
mgnify:CR=1 FL=1